MTPRSRRIPEDLSLNRLAAARSRIGEIPYDLTVSNPTLCGIPYPSDLLAPLSDPGGLVYDPNPRGPLAARRAIASEYRRWDAEPDPRRIVLTVSTSEAYSFLFRLFCDPGDAVLVPSPSYPLFAHLARLDGVRAQSYSLDGDAAWRIDFAALEHGTTGVRAVVVVHPNNPTGSFVHPEDRERLVYLCRERGWALIADEVFLTYPVDGGPGEGTTFCTVEDSLCCVLGGLSKSLGLPQLKLAWIVVSGPQSLVEPTLDGLDYVADNVLSVSTPVALALPSLLRDGAPVQDAIAHRCQSNIQPLRELAADHEAVDLPPLGGGWSAVLRVPAVIDEQDLCLSLLQRHGVGVYPGQLFGFTSGAWLVLNLLAKPAIFAEGARRIFEYLDGTLTRIIHEDS